MTTDPSDINDYAEKNAWLFHSLSKNVNGPAVTPLMELPVDASGVTIPDGHAAWQALSAWYKGPITC